MRLFGSSGIRGIANREITPELALKVGLAAGALGKTAVIGRDPRIAAPMTQHAVTAGLLSNGCSAVDAGLVSTPTLAHATQDHDLGLMITASHNPAPYCGIKLWNPDGMAFNTRQQRRVESLIENPPEKPEWTRIGRSEVLEGAVESHTSAILRHVGDGAGLRVVVDCGGGAGATITPQLLRMMGCEVVELNTQPDGYFSARNPEPTESTLSQLMKVVREEKADLGIAHDGDADRMMAVDDRARFVSGDKMLAYLAKREGGHRIVAPVDTSMAVDDYLDVEVIYTRVGDVFVAEKIKETKADFGGEPSGSWIYPNLTYCPDGILAAARLIDHVSGEGSFSESLDRIPEYPTLRGSVSCEDKTGAMRLVEQALRDQGRVDTMDGVRLNLDDGWVLVRPSGTEPKIRVTAEARDKGRAERLYDMAYNIVHDSIRGDMNG